MDKMLFNLIAEQTPRFNDLVVDGLATKHMRNVEAYVDRIWRTAAKDFPPQLEYLGMRRCTPREQFAEHTKKHSGPSTVEFARSYMYMVKIFLRFEGKDLEPRHLYLPFVSDAGIIEIRGSTFAIAPVLADKAISVGQNSIFIPLNRDQLTFYRELHTFMRDGVREATYPVWSKMHHKAGKPIKGAPRAKSFIRGKTTLGHYLFAKFGLQQTFAIFCNTDVTVDTVENMTPDRFPPEEYVICTSTRMIPRTVRDKYYVGSNLALAIPREDYNLTTSSLIGAFFYVVDHFPARVEPDFVNDTLLWQVLLGHLLFGGGGNEGALAKEVQDHLKTLDGYVDSEARGYLQDDGLECEDLYQLLMHIIETFSHRITQSSNQLASMYDKRLVVMRYVMKDVRLAINTLMFKVSGFKKKVLTEKDVSKLLRQTIKPQLSMSINRNHGEVSSVSCAGDNKYFKITSRCVQQVESSGGRGQTRVTADDPTKFLHSSIAEVGSINTMGKSEPTGRDKINPCVHVREGGLIERNPILRELLDGVQSKIQR